MISIDRLKAYGANVDEGLARCMNNEDFYLRVVNMALADANFDKLKAAVEKGDTPAAFEAAHALKGLVGNVALTPILKPVCALSDTLKGNTDQPIPSQCQQLAEEVFVQLEKARGL